MPNHDNPDNTANEAMAAPAQAPDRSPDPYPDCREAFRSVLRKAIGNRTQAQFAREAGISARSLSRMLSGAEPRCPTKATLMKIAGAAANGVIFSDLSHAAYDDWNEIPPEGEAKPEPVPTAALEPAFLQIAEAFQRKSYPCVAESVAAFVEDAIAEARGSASGLPMIAYAARPARKYFGERYPNVHSWTRVDLSAVAAETSGQSAVIVYHNGIEDCGGRPKLLIVRASMSMGDVADLYGVPGCALGKFDGLEPEKALRRALALPCAVRLDALRPVGPRSYTSEAALLNALFDEGTRFSSTVNGIGFWLESKPPRMWQFVSDHAAYIAEFYVRAKAIDPDDQADVEALFRYGSPEKIRDYVRDVLQGGADADLSELRAAGYLIAAAMREETGFPFCFMEPAEDLSEFPNLSDAPCVLIDKADVRGPGLLRDTVLLTVLRYARELGVPRFGDIVFTHVDVFHGAGGTYEVPEGEPEGEPDPDDAGIEMQAYVPGESEPAENGLYLVQLKDGRALRCMFLKRDGSPVRWIARHKAWDGMVAWFCPEKIETGD